MLVTTNFQFFANFDLLASLFDFYFKYFFAILDCIFVQSHKIISTWFWFFISFLKKFFSLPQQKKWFLFVRNHFFNLEYFFDWTSWFFVKIFSIEDKKGNFFYNKTIARFVANVTSNSIRGVCFKKPLNACATPINFWNWQPQRCLMTRSSALRESVLRLLKLIFFINIPQSKIFW